MNFKFRTPNSTVLLYSTSSFKFHRYIVVYSVATVL